MEGTDPIVTPEQVHQWHALGLRAAGLAHYGQGQHAFGTGAALDAWMLYANWVRGETKPDVVTLENYADHIDHVCQLAGNAKHSAIGTDLDGGFGNEQTPIDLRIYSDLQNLGGILAKRG